MVAKREFSKSSPAPENTAATISLVTETSHAVETPLPPLSAPNIQPVAQVKTNAVRVADLSQDERQAKIGEEIMRINGVIGQNDSNAVALILNDLTNSEKEVRQQAVEAVKQLGDRDAIPALTNLVARTEDYEERHALQEAADFLAAPTLAEAEQNTTPNATRKSPNSPVGPHPHGAQNPNRRTGQRAVQQQAQPTDPAAANSDTVPNN